MTPEDNDQIKTESTNENAASTPKPQFSPNFATPNAASRPTQPFRVPPPRPIRFGQIVLKDLATTVVGVATFCFLAFFLLIIGLGAFVAILDDASTSALVVEETLSGDDKSAGKIVVLPIEGTIETDEYGFLREAIDIIAEDERVRGVVLRINSPGGTISGSDYYYTLLKDLKEELDIPIVASMGDLAASGGYYVATAADRIFAERSTLTGSIGVIVPMYDASALCEKFGVASTPVVSGPMKGMGDFMKKPTPEETAVWQALVDESYEQFLDVVRAGRPWYRGEEKQAAPRRRVEGVSAKVFVEEDETAPELAEQPAEADDETLAETVEQPAEADDETLAETAVPTKENATANEREQELRRVADGRIYTANQALELRLIDEIGFLDDAIAATIEAAGLTAKTAQVVRFEETESWSSALGLSALAPASKPLDKALETVATPRGYYMLPRALPISAR
ncbi:MAG: signal peptide peptidase SppA [Thermoguttaceae bacterium]|nr:signal peptide peptidase SppA [Thermoguttaceae bacterium]